MTGHSNRFGSPAAMAGVIFGVLYLAVLAVVSSLLPLRPDEILGLYAFHSGSWTAAMHWIASLPGATVGYFVSQAPLVALFGQPPVIARLVSFVCGALCLLIVWQLAKFAGIRNLFAVLVVLAFMPTEFVSFMSARPAAESVFAALLALLLFLRLTEKPTILRAIVYAILLTGTIYINPFAYAPAVGCLLFFFRFVARRLERRAIWFILPGTVAPLLLYLPYYIWAAPQASRNTLGSAAIPGGISEQIWIALAGNSAVSGAVLAVIVAGALAAVWPSFQPRFPVEWSRAQLRRNVSIFVFLGGALSSIVFAAIYAQVNFTPVTPAEVIVALPLLVLLFFCAVEYFLGGQFVRVTVPVLAALVAISSMAADYQFTRNAKDPDIQLLADAAWSPLSSLDSCVVFVSEGLSRPLFLALDPTLESRECMNFFHKTVVLEVQPYVRPNQRENALSFFRGLNFRIVRHQEIGGGSVITMRQSSEK